MDAPDGHKEIEGKVEFASIVACFASAEPAWRLDVGGRFSESRSKGTRIAQVWQELGSMVYKRIDQGPAVSSGWPGICLVTALRGQKRDGNAVWNSPVRVDSEDSRENSLQFAGIPNFMSLIACVDL